MSAAARTLAADSASFASRSTSAATWVARCTPAARTSCAPGRRCAPCSFETRRRRWRFRVRDYASLPSACGLGLPGNSSIVPSSPIRCISSSATSAGRRVKASSNGIVCRLSGREAAGTPNGGKPLWPNRLASIPSSRRMLAVRYASQ